MSAQAIYSDLMTEYQAISTAAGLHDASYVGRLKASGEDALDLLNRLSTNNVIDLESGQGAPTILTTDRGRILDLIGVVNLGGYVLLVTSPGCQERVIEFLDKYTIMEDLMVEDITEDSTMFSVLGPTSGPALEAATGAGIDHLAPYHSVPVEMGGVAATVICRPLGQLPSFDVLVSPEDASTAWDYLQAAGLNPVGTEAVEIARIKNAVPAFGPEMGEPYNPLEAGLIGSIDFTKGCYIGQEVIARLDTYQRVQKYLVTLSFSPDAQVAEGSTLVRDGKQAGSVTSVTRLPDDGAGIGLAYVRKASAEVGVRLELEEPSSGWAEVRDLPKLFGTGQD